MRQWEVTWLARVNADSPEAAARIAGTALANSSPPALMVREVRDDDAPQVISPDRW